MNQDRTELGSAVLARHIAKPFASVDKLQASDKSSDVRQRLIDAKYTFAPVLEGDKVVGRVMTEDLPKDNSTLVGSVMCPFDGDMVVAGDSPVRVILESLASERFLFVLSENCVTGIVTPSDMGGSAARTHYYLLLAQLEVTFAEIIRRAFPNQVQAVELLPRQRQEAHWKLFNDLFDKDAEIDHVAAMHLHELLAIVGKLESILVLVRKRGFIWKDLVHGLDSFRNDVMHPVREFTRAAPDQVMSLRDYHTRIEALIDIGKEWLTDLLLAHS